VAWFLRAKPGPSAEELLGRLAELGISARNSKAVLAVREQVGEGFKGRYDILLAALGDVPFDISTYESQEPYSNDVWHFDYEAIEDHGAYKFIVENCARLADGHLSFDVVTDYVDVVENTAWVELQKDGAVDRIDLRVDNDWTDPAIFEQLNERLKTSGSARRLAQHALGQDCLLLCKELAEIAEINRRTGLRFEPHFR